MPQGIEIILRIALAVIGAYVVAFWFSLVVWTFRDVQKRTRDVLVQVLATMLVLLFNLPGLFLYTILRPPETLAEAYARSLEEESLMQDLEERQACPKCRHSVEPDYLVCPSCGTQLKQVCPHCQRLTHLGWRVCPFCAKPTPVETPLASDGPGTSRVQQAYGGAAGLRGAGRDRELGQWVFGGIERSLIIRCQSRSPSSTLLTGQCRQQPFFLPQPL